MVSRRAHCFATSAICLVEMNLDELELTSQVSKLGAKLSVIDAAGPGLVSDLT
jgi:hypothetical protein